MTKTFTTAAVAVLALTMGAFSLATPALANGQVSISYTPTDAEESQALGLGLQMFGMMQGMSKNGGIHQNGNNNSGGIGQNGSGNNGVLIQDGDNHNGTISQNGNNNNCGLFQFGEGTDAECVQNGDGNSSVTGVFGF